jgi:RNA polymerase sigma-70 factor (ECF subfamily)
MCSIARHEIADYYRKRYAKKALKTLPLVDWLVCEYPKDATEVAESVRATLLKMTPKYRNLLLGKYLDDYSVKQLANQHDKTEKSIESDLFRAREEFKELWVGVSEA